MFDNLLSTALGQNPSFYKISEYVDELNVKCLGEHTVRDTPLVPPFVTPALNKLPHI